MLRVPNKTCLLSQRSALGLHDAIPASVEQAKCRLSGGLASALRVVPEALGIVSDLDDLAIVRQPVEQGCGHFASPKARLVVTMASSEWYAMEADLLGARDQPGNGKPALAVWGCGYHLATEREARAA